MDSSPTYQLIMYKMEKKSAVQKILSNPITRIVLGLAVCFGGFLIGQNIAGKFLGLTSFDKDFRNLFKGITASIFVIGSYKIFYQWIERRKVLEISMHGIGWNASSGILIGTVLQCLTVSIIYAFDGFQIISIHPVSFIIIPLTVAFTVAIFEEILIRGILLRIIEESLGSYITLIISALIFGGLHLLNPNSSLTSAFCVAVEGGLLLGASYIYTRNLWFPIAIHFAWNFIQSGIFGAITSGNEKTNSLFTTQIIGPTFITGGPFGPEGTIQATIFCGFATIVLMYFNIKKNKLIEPCWKNKQKRLETEVFVALKSSQSL